MRKRDLSQGICLNIAEDLDPTGTLSTDQDQDLNISPNTSQDPGQDQSRGLSQDQRQDPNLDQRQDQNQCQDQGQDLLLRPPSLLTLALLILLHHRLPGLSPHLFPLRLLRKNQGNDLILIGEKPGKNQPRFRTSTRYLYRFLNLKRP